MSHQVEQMAYVGQTPWHGLGNQLTQGVSIDQWRVEAGLNWHAKRAAVMFTEDDVETVANPQLFKGDSEVLYRSDTRSQLGIVSPDYKIVQPGEVLEFFRDLVSTGDMSIETAGCLDGGKKVWALAKTGQDFRIMGQDAIEGYLLLATSFDGTLSTRAQFTSVRVVCNNTLQMSIKGKSSNAVAIPHSAMFRESQVKLDLGILDNSFAQFEEQANVLANRRMSDKEAVRFIMNVLTGEDDAEKLSTRSANVVKHVYGMYAGNAMGSSLRSSDSTAWGALNAITEYVDHQQGRNTNNRFRSAQFGAGATTKATALEKALELAA
jgi:phage/plasmid-like protein (TIGR03299 family)